MVAIQIVQFLDNSMLTETHMKFVMLRDAAATGLYGTISSLGHC
jgi:hypothetical protein